MKRYIILYCIIFSCFKLAATTQESDRLIWEGDTIYIAAEPLINYPQLDSILNANKIQWARTSCYRGYKCEWIVEDSQLYLNKLLSCGNCSHGIAPCNEDKSFKMDVIFPNQLVNNKLPATFFTGQIYINWGEMVLEIVESKYIHENETILEFKSGRLVRVNKVVNPFPKLSPFSIYIEDLKFIYSDSLRAFLQSKVNWSKIPVIRKEQRVIITITSGSSPKDFKISIQQDSEIPEVNDEVERLLKLIKKWDVIYWHGEPYHYRYSFPIIFTESKRK